MSQDKENTSEKYIFEFYDDDFSESLEPEISKIAEKYNDVDFESDLNEEQLEIVNNIQGPMLVIAGAGSGKTRTISYSVAKLLLSGVNPGQIMLVTFTNKAASEMIKRVEILLGKRPKGTWAGTFHSIANRFLRMYAKTMGLKPNYTIMDQTDANGLMKLSINNANVKELPERFPTAAMTKSILSYSINCNKSVKEVVQWKYEQFNSDEIIKKLEEVFRIYRVKKAEDNLVDFDDLLLFWNTLLDERNVAQMIARRIKYILVDEYQDTNHLQDEIIFKIVQQNKQKNVMVVGDDAQSIYAFRGANFQNILNFEKRYKDCKRYTITYNYRSVPEILCLANDSIKHNLKQFKKSMKATRPQGIQPFRVNTADDKEQARFIANQILKLRSEGFELHEIAILIRATHHALKIELELRAKNIPYEVRAGVAFFEKAHIKDIIAHLRIIENPYDEISWSRIFSIIPGVGIKSATKIFEAISKEENPINSLLYDTFFSRTLKGARIAARGKTNIKNHVSKLQGLSPEDEPSEIISRLINVIEDHIKTKYENWKDRLDDLEQLSIYAQNFGTIRKFLENLSLNSSNIESKTVKQGSKKEEERPIVLSTIHRAKGLEWRVIFIPMLCEDSFPSGRVVGDPEAYEEERRVFYVAVTRAKDNLYLVAPTVVQSYRGEEIKRASQFIEEINPENYTEAIVKFKETRRSRRGTYSASFRSASDLYTDRN